MLRPIAKGHCSIIETSVRLSRFEELEVKRKFVFLKGSYPKTRTYFSVAEIVKIHGHEDLMTHVRKAESGGMVSFLNLVVERPNALLST